MYVLGFWCCRCVRVWPCVCLSSKNLLYLGQYEGGKYTEVCMLKCQLRNKSNARWCRRSSSPPHPPLSWNVPADFRNNEQLAPIPWQYWTGVAVVLQNINLHLRPFIIIIIITTITAMILIITTNVLHLNKVAHFQFLHSNAFLLEVGFLSHHHYARGKPKLG